MCFSHSLHRLSTILTISISRATAGLNVTCVDLLHPSHQPVRLVDSVTRTTPANEICVVTGMEDILLESSRLRFTADAFNVSAITFVQFRTKATDTRFTTFPEEIFEIFPNVASIVVVSNLASLSPDNWPENAKKLKLFYAGSNNISQLSTFNAFDSLEELYLRNNKLKSIRRDTFEAVDKLKWIDLSRNQLTIIVQGTFVRVKELQLLDLSFNQIQTIEDGAFDNPSLETLWLDNNQLTGLSDLVFSKISNLKEISMRSNKLVHIGQSLYSLQNLVTIGLDDNQIEDIDLLGFAKLTRMKKFGLINSGFSFGLQKEEIQSSPDVSDKNLSLESLNIENKILTNVRNLHELRMFNGLKILTLSVPFTDFDELNAEEIKTFLPNLERLDLDIKRRQCADVRILMDKLQQLNVTLNANCCSTLCSGPALLNSFLYPCRSCDL